MEAYKSKITIIKGENMSLSSSGWNFRGILLQRRYKSGFSKLKEMYGNEVTKRNKTKLTSKPLTKEDKRKIKEKIKNQITKQNKKKILAFIIAFVLTVFFLIAVVYILSLYYEL